MINHKAVTSCNVQTRERSAVGIMAGGIDGIARAVHFGCEGYVAQIHAADGNAVQGSRGVHAAASNGLADAVDGSSGIEAGFTRCHTAGAATRGDFAGRASTSSARIVEIVLRLQVNLRHYIAVLDSLGQTAQIAAKASLIEHELAIATEPVTALVLAADDDAGSYHNATMTQYEVVMVSVELKSLEVQTVLPVRAWELALAVHNLGGHGRTAAVRVAGIEHDTCIVHIILTLKFLDSDESQLVFALQAPCRDKVGVGAARCIDICLVAAFCINAHRDLGQMSLRDDGGKGRPLVALNRHELVELAQALTRALQRCRTLAKVAQVDRAEAVGALTAIAETLERVVTDELQHGVGNANNLN